MKSESPELAALFDHARQGDEPSDDDRRRVTARVAERLALGAGVGAAALTLTRFGWATSFKAWGTVALALAGMGSGVYWFVTDSEGPSPSVTVRPAPVVSHVVSGRVVPAPDLAASVENHEAAPERAAEPAPVRRAAVASAAPASPSGEPGLLARETAALRAANEALRSGAPARALTLLDAFAKEFPRGALTEEALATRVSALCRLGRVAEARALGSRFVQRYPRSPVAARVRGSCAMPKE